jgi:hypothetical protein
LGEDKDLMPPSFKSINKIDKKRSLNDVMGMGWKGRSNNANIHYFVLVMVNSDGKFG